MTSLSAGTAPGRSEFNTTAASAGCNPTSSTTAAPDLDPRTLSQNDSPDSQQDLAAVLTFSDISSELSQLRYDPGHQPQQPSQPTTAELRAVNNANHTESNHNTKPPAAHPSNPQQQSQQLFPPNNDHTPNSTTPTSTIASSSSATHFIGPRKPSPGLAARLKALGFGTNKAHPPPPSNLSKDPDSIGRLPEEQIRKIDQEHQANLLNPVIERRGRPWKGPIVRIPSRSSLKSSKSLYGDRDSKASPSEEKENVAAAAAGGEEVEAAKAEFLPEIVASQPLEMDTNKYRLPDHTNGNGVKAQIEVREEHIARDVRSPDIPPPPLPKDTPPLPQSAAVPTTPVNDVFNASSYFNPLGLQRPGSIYTLSRASLATQLAQLTSIQLPDAESLSSKVSAIPTAQSATKALIGAAEQIHGWIYKASEVIGGLESEDDVEWAAAGGREGVEEVEGAIIRFEELINVYVSAIEELQSRPDIAAVSASDLTRAVAQMEAIMDEWTKIRTTLHSIKAQVEIAMEWEELWNTVLGEIQNEMDELSRMVFEMEERRHKSALAAASGDSVDIGDLETIVEETPAALKIQPVNNRFSLPAFPASPSSPSPGASGMSQDDSSLLALFARMQPLRASLDFLPMRLSVFEARAERTFPTACDELEMRRAGLDASYKKLEKDAESLRKELGEDRWVLVFRGAGRQAQKMYESVERSVSKLKEAVDAGMHLTNPPTMSKKIESYEAKKTHYGPAIERVLGIIDKGVKDRLTVNGEILRLHNEMQTKWSELKDHMADMDILLEDLQADKKGQQLRDSISSMLSNDRSTLGSGHETPGSSPPSSIIMSTLGLAKPAPPKASKQRSASIGTRLPQPSNRRQSSLPTPASQPPRKPLTPRMSALSTPTREGSATPTGSRGNLPPSVHNNKPRWNGSTVGIDTGHNFKPLSLTTPSPYAKTPPATVRSQSSLTPSSSSKLFSGLRSPLGRAASMSPAPEDTPSKERSTSSLAFRNRLASPGPYSQQVLSQPKLGVPKPRLANQASMSALNDSRRSSLQPPPPPSKAGEAGGNGAPVKRPASSLAAGRRTSALPQPRLSLSVTGEETGRVSPQAVAGARFAMRKSSSSASASGDKPKDNRPRWRS